MKTSVRVNSRSKLQQKLFSSTVQAYSTAYIGSGKDKTYKYNQESLQSEFFYFYTSTSLVLSFFFAVCSTCTSLYTFTGAWWRRTEGTQQQPSVDQYGNETFIAVLKKVFGKKDQSFDGVITKQTLAFAVMAVEKALIAPSLKDWAIEYDTIENSSTRGQAVVSVF